MKNLFLIIISLLTIIPYSQKISIDGERNYKHIIKKDIPKSILTNYFDWGSEENISNNEGEDSRYPRMVFLI